MSDTLGEAFPKEQARCRGLLKQYEQLRSMPGVNVNFAVAAIEAVLKKADEAAISGDPVAMLRAFQAMKDCE